jgi:hypothetical protein
MQCHEAQDIARRWIQNVDALLWRDPLRCNDASDRTKKTLLDELL